MDDDEDDTPDFMSPGVAEARDIVGKAISAYLNVIRPDENPYPVAWVVAAEWTNTDLELTGRAGRDVIMPTDQTLSASSGLGNYITSRFA